MRSRRLRWLLLIPFALVAVVAEGCGAGESADTTTTAEAAREDTTTAAETTTTNLAPAPIEDQLAGLRILDENTFTVELVVADPEFPLRLAYPAYFALPDSAFEDPAAQNEMPIGNGPFMMEAPWEHEVRIRAVRNPDYLGPDPARVDAYVWDLQSNWNTASNLGDLDVSSVPPDLVLLESAQRNFGENYKESDWAGILALGIPAYLDQYTKEHRQALSMAVDRDLVNQQLTDSRGTPAHGVVPPAVGGRNDVCASWDHKPEEAKALWDAAGGLDEIVISFPGTTMLDWLQIVRDTWVETLGIDSDTVTLSYRIAPPAECGSAPQHRQQIIENRGELRPSIRGGLRHFGMR
jgi:ABC-type transport system substrate-binding protein